MNANYVESAWQERLHLLLLLLQNNWMSRGEDDDKDVVRTDQWTTKARYMFIITDVQNGIISST